MRPILAPASAKPVQPGQVPSFSVIISAYQAADFIAEAVGSALDQTVPPLEVIVCDDASTDDTERALRRYRDRVTYIRHDENRGEAAAKNTAARAASGDFLALLDPDDLYMPERIEALGELASVRPDLDILSTDAYIEAGGRVIRRCYESDWVFEVDDQRRAILERDFPDLSPAVRRGRFWEVGGLDESIAVANDWDCWIRVIHSGSRAGLVNEPQFRYRLRETSTTFSSAARVARWEVRVLEKAARDLKLTPDERYALNRTVQAKRRVAELEATREAALDGAADTRRRWLAIAAGEGYPLRTRAKAAVAAAAPGIARRLLRSRESRTWHAAGVRLPRAGATR
jgi:glycosyltransferase involved in cell wall biosynthesis